MVKPRSKALPVLCPVCDARGHRSRTTAVSASWSHRHQAAASPAGAVDLLYETKRLRPQA